MNILLPLKYCLLNCPFNSRSFIYNVCIIDTQYVWLSEVTYAKHASHRKRDSLRSGPAPVRGVTCNDNDNDNALFGVLYSPMYSCFLQKNSPSILIFMPRRPYPLL